MVAEDLRLVAGKDTRIWMLPSNEPEHIHLTSILPSTKTKKQVMKATQISCRKAKTFKSF